MSDRKISRNFFIGLQNRPNGKNVKLGYCTVVNFEPHVDCGKGHCALQPFL